MVEAECARCLRMRPVGGWILAPTIRGDMVVKAFCAECRSLPLLSDHEVWYPSRQAAELELLKRSL